MAPQFLVENAWAVVIDGKAGAAAHVPGATPQQTTSKCAEANCLRTYGRIGRNCHGLHRFEKLLALADEQSICGEALDRRHRAAKSIGQWTNHRNGGEGYA